MLAVYIFFSVHWFELLISKVFLMPYQEGWIEISDAEKNRNICESDCHRYFPLVLGGFIRSRFILLSCLAMPSLILERLLATKNVRDYEHVPRKYIPIAIIIFVEIISTIAAFSTILSFLGSVTILAAFISLLDLPEPSTDRLFMKSFPIGNRKYTLTKKYQIEENLRVLKLPDDDPPGLHHSDPKMASGFFQPSLHVFQPEIRGKSTFDRPDSVHDRPEH
ncbi:unnamed protein product [Caenorhabditis auriculariae]|uniref:Uncharacterized protein n=1 Tax=Caenorhabditis auriculariae TaxID=2777116 RepID=A0A8S1HUE6_9PELO|nr:unnamed protein product [Caenorhabditis auriculariae]